MTNMERLAPKVTGLSPMTGVPGTKITIRGENLGESSEDIISLTINGQDCWPYLEWKSPKKIVTRCSRGIGSGDVIITTKSGGLGNCDVQFNCYEETVSPTEESAVWVNEITYSLPEQEKLGTIAGTNEEFSVDISSTRFKPQLYLIQNFSNAELGELAKISMNLQTQLNNKSDPDQISTSSNRAFLLKSNLSTIMECLQILEHLSRVVAIDSKDNLIENIIESIKKCHQRTHDLFDPLLVQRDLVQSIESAMQVFKQNETLFNLPSAIETSIKSKNYDSVVKEISGVLSRLKTIEIDQTLSKKIQNDVTSKIDKLKSTIETQLHQICKCNTTERSIDDVKKLISHLNRLGDPINYDIWIAVREMRDSLRETLTERYEYFLKLSLDESKIPQEPPIGSVVNSLDNSQNSKPPYVVEFVHTAMKIFHETYYDIITLGRSYFDPKDEFSCKDSNDIKHERMIEFEDMMICRPIIDLTNVLRLSLVPDSSKLDKPSLWPPNETGAYVSWLKNVLQSVIGCHIHLTKVNLPSSARSALEDFREFLFELRVRSMQILFLNAARFNKNLHHQEDWAIEVDDVFGGRTKLPFIFEKNVIETLKFANETIFKTSLPDEKSILKRVDIQASMKELVHSLINSFIDSLDHALIDNKEHPEESNRLLLACKNSKRVPSKYLNRILITMCNCQFTKTQIFPKLQDEFEKLEGLKMERVFWVCSNKYTDYISKISKKFCHIKCAELTRSLKEKNHPNTTNMDDLRLDLLIVTSSIYMVAPQLVDNLMTSIFDTMQKEIEQQQSAQTTNVISNGSNLQIV